MMFACGIVMSSLLAAAASTMTTLIAFDRDTAPEHMKQNDTRVSPAMRKGRPAMRVDFSAADWPNVTFTPAGEPWDMSDYAGIQVNVFNPGTEPVDVCIRVDDDPGANGLVHCNTGDASIVAGRAGILRVRFSTKAGERLWGMRGLPERGPMGHGPIIDTSHIVAFQIFLPKPPEPRTLLVTGIRLFGKGSAEADRVAFPFVDRFGQYMHDTWPGKLKDESEFTKRLRREKRAIASSPSLPGRDKFGGWADGPQREATGWFRTEQIDGTWWLVTPEGHLFFSVGIDCVTTSENTFITQREPWFAWLPDAEDPAYKAMFGQGSGAHSMADIIGGKGRTFSFYRANLQRKYGDAWPERWRESVYPRLKSWGFNTIANWSQGDVLEQSPMPFVATIGIGGEIREVEGARGYWGRMRDVYDPSFTKAAEASIPLAAEKFAANPLCIGFFVDNEMPWEALRAGTLASPPDQPCRKALVEQLQAKYGSLEKLNRAWATQAETWELLRVPDKANAECNADLDKFVYSFAYQYFKIVDKALKAHAPHQLYLGCRFSSAPPMAVRACADVADVVSFNLYHRTVECDRWCGANSLGKPLIIGEFHFGALDRGMFHPGLVKTESQKDRASQYVKYVESVLDCPSFVGCHWFQYVDEPITGRWFDGENYNIGFLDVTDTPYPEMIEGARRVHAEVYGRHGGRR